MNTLKTPQKDSLVRIILSTLFSVVIILLALFATPTDTGAQYYTGLPCGEYGTFAYEDWDGSCRCMAGYVFGQGILGETQCVSGDSVCYDKYGYGSRYDSLSNSCECSAGYVFGTDSIGRTQCISESQACQNQLGSHSRSTYGGKCECSYGYVIDGGKCVNADRVCRSRHGLHASYDSLDNACSCDSGYTLGDDGQCVEKHNSAYFRLLDIDPKDDARILVESNHNLNHYIIELGFGCWDYALETYKDKDLVINMGTDFDIDIGDIVVLQNHDMTCDIWHYDWTLEDTFESDEPEVAMTPRVAPTPVTPTRITTPEPTPSRADTPQIAQVVNTATESNEPRDAQSDTHPEDSSTGENLEVETLQATSTTTTTEPTQIETEATPKRLGVWVRFKFWIKNLFN